MPNRLAQQSSPYLLQHQDNPVDWYPWGPEALERSRGEQKPIFLSIGYSACHWCHVMEHESFENPAIADALNGAFVCIKVDREERPDLDQIYMTAVQMLTGRGGWPMSVFLTPDLEPFYGGTYWPPTKKLGMPGFDEVIAAVAAAWRDRREKAIESAGEIADRMRELAAPETVPGELSMDLLAKAAAQLERSFDFQHGGFGGAPKFPHSMDLQVLLRYWQRNSNKDAVLLMVCLALDKMAAGGIYDHLGGGFARYSVDAEWLVPHFEKMLYDNSLLTLAYLEGYQATGIPQYARVVRETLDYILRDMTDPAGGFHSTEDADSEGEEGKYYVWTPAELDEILGPAAAETFAQVYDVTAKGNFEGHSILHLQRPIAQVAEQFGRSEGKLQTELAESRAKLLAAREKRIRPGKDDKILVSWNGLMIDALAKASGVLDEPRYAAAAVRAADFLLAELCRPDGRLLHTWRHGRASLDAYLDDYASLANALVSVFEATGEARFITSACALADVMLQQFRDDEQGGFFYTATDHEKLLARQKDWQDSSVPSGNALAAMALSRLARLTGRADYALAAEETLQLAVGLMQEAPFAVGQMLLALDFYQGPTVEIVLCGGNDQAATQQVLAGLHSRFIPRKVLAVRKPQSTPMAKDAPLSGLLAGKTSLSAKPTVYICEHFTCQAPVTGTEACLELWERLKARAE